MTDSPRTPEDRAAPRRARVLAIIVNWNKKDFVDQLLTALGSLERGPDEILVVDNASSDGSVEMLRRKHPGVQLACNARNVGGSGGFNAGMRWGLERGGFDYFWLLDNDVVVHEGALSALLEVAEADPAVGLVGSRIAELGHPEKTQEVGARVHWPDGTLRKQGMGERFPDWWQGPATVFDVDYAASCSLLARVAAIERVGIWDEGYFVFFDDIEWGVRFGRAGWKVKATSASLIEHESFHERRLLQALSAIHLSLRNGLYFMHQYCPPRARPGYFLRVFRQVLHDLVLYRLDGRKELARCLAWGVRDFFRSVRGKSPHSFEDDSLTRETAAEETPLSTQVPLRKGRILFWTMSASPATVRTIEDLRRMFPKHTVEVLAPAELGELNDLRVQGLVRRPTRTRSDRLALAWWALRRYDAVAREQRRARLMFEHLFPVSIWYSEKGGIGITRNTPLNAVWMLLARPFVFLGAVCLTLMALLKPRPRVDYFTWVPRTAESRSPSSAGASPDPREH
jgi:hypothetical protein